MQTEHFVTLLKGFARRYGRLLSLVLIAVLLFSVQQRDPLGLYSGLQTSVWNSYQRWGAALNAKQPLVLVVQVDRKSIETVRRVYGEDWPWTRQRYAELLRILFEEYHVGVVGIDIFMPDTRDTLGNQQLLQLAQQYPIVFSQVFDFSLPDVAMEAGKLVGGLTPQDAQALDYFPQAQGYVGLNAQLAQAPCVGHVSPLKDKQSGMITHVPPLVAYQGKLYPMLALEMLRCQVGGEYHVDVRQNPNGWELILKDLLGEGGDSRMVLDEKGLWRVPFRIKSDAFIGIFASDVLQRKVHPAVAQQLANSMVLLAGTAPGLGDQHPTPLAASEAGVTVHLQMLEWLLDDATAPPNFSLDYWTWVIGFAALMIFYLLLVSNVGVGWVMFAPIAVMLAWLALGFWAWLEKQWFVPLHPFMLALAFLVLVVPLEWWLAQRTSGRLRKLFQDYLPAQLVGHIVNDNRHDLLLPSKRCLTLLFADIANFTQRAERISPERLAELTQQILERLTAVAHQHGGTVDKYMGDAVMVFWNAPFPQEDHADRAVAAALDMMAAIAQFNQEGNHLLQGEPIAVRIGVHSGEVVVGDLGTRFRHAYTAIGDAVNVTARLQSLARELEEYLVVSKQTVERLQQDWHLVSRGEVPLKGRQESVSVYTLAQQPNKEG